MSWSNIVDAFNCKRRGLEMPVSLIVLQAACQWKLKRARKRPVRASETVISRVWWAQEGGLSVCDFSPSLKEDTDLLSSNINQSWSAHLFLLFIVPSSLVDLHSSVVRPKYFYSHHMRKSGVGRIWKRQMDLSSTTRLLSLSQINPNWHCASVLNSRSGFIQT